MEDFLTLKLSRLENFKALKLSWLENVRALIQLMTGNNNLNILSAGLCCLFMITWFMGAVWIILGLTKKCVKF
jgi:hypothetical protein